MKLYFVVFILLWISSCKEKLNMEVITINLTPKGILDERQGDSLRSIALKELHNIYVSNLNNKNYEVIGLDTEFGINWNPSQKILFLGEGSGLCNNWRYAFKNVDEEKLLKVINKNISFTNMNSVQKVYAQHFEEILDKVAIDSLYNAYFMTNSCGKKR